MAKRNWADLMGKALAYVVLRKGNRLQVVVGPTDKQLRRLGKRDWRVVAFGEATGRVADGVTDEMREAVLTGLAALTRDDRP